MGKYVIPEGVRLAQMVSEGKLSTCLLGWVPLGTHSKLSVIGKCALD